MQTHHPPWLLRGQSNKSVQVLFAALPGRKAIIFIHGFSGDAMATWSDFSSLLPEHPKCSGSDLYFYGYDGLRADMYASAALFRDFLDQLLADTARFFEVNLPHAVRRETSFEYEELIIAAHSLGAVISRRALLDATKEGSAWVAKTKLILYAPAHRGARVTTLALEVASSFPFLKFFGATARFKSPLIDQLQPNSPALKQLLDDSITAREGGANSHLIAKKVVIAEYENIVENQTSGDDPAPRAIAGASHVSVCKPSKIFLSPLTMLEDIL
jgi:pimeloyl-ACP methyl ester carboxylesterase